jgi:hypothetical protein
MAHRAANQGSLVQKAIADINHAITDLDAANDFHMAHREMTAVVRAEIQPNFNPPQRPAPNRNIGLEGSLARLKEAFDLLNDAPAGELGGYRAKVYADIANAAGNLIAAMNQANAGFSASRPGATNATNDATPSPASTN